MKLNFGKRLVLFLHWLLSLIVLALVAIGIVIPDLAEAIVAKINQLLGAGLSEIAGIAIIILYLILSILTVIFIFSRGSHRGERGFITVDSSEAGRTRIAIGAVEQMIRQAVRSVDGIADMKSSIVNGEDAISINTSVAIVSGAHVPTVTMNIQRAIRSYIELNCGVAVREVGVSVHTLTSDDEGVKGGRKRTSVNASVNSAPVYIPPVYEAAKEEGTAVPVQDNVETPESIETDAPAADEASAEESEVSQ